MLKSQTEGGEPVYIGDEMLQKIRDLSEERLKSYILMGYIKAQETRSLMAARTENGEYSFRILPKTQQEISYFGNLSLVAKINKAKMEYTVLSEDYSLGFVRTKSSELLFGSFIHGISAMDSYYV